MRNMNEACGVRAGKSVRPSKKWLLFIHVFFQCALLLIYEASDFIFATYLSIFNHGPSDVVS